MPNRKLCTGSAALACLALVGKVTAAPTFKILYHQRLDMSVRVDLSGQQHLTFDAYGRRFEVDLQSNDNIARAVPADRSDIKPYRGTLSGLTGSWVRLTQSRDGWRGIVSDGHELYGIEPANDLQQAAVQPLPEGGSSSTPVIYRLADTLLPDGAAVCGTDPTESLASSTTDRPTALKAFTRLATELSQKDTTLVPTRELVVEAVADHAFTDAVGPDPEGAIIARWDIVDGIWSSQVGIKIVLSPVTILTDQDDSFSATTDPSTLLAEVSGYRAGRSAHDGSGLTHLMTGRHLDGNIVGIAYLSSVCDGNQSVSLSQSTTSSTMGALIAAHELGHNFNAPHDGVAGACSSTPETFLMAPVINFSDQFSSCSLQTIQLRAKTAACLVQTAAGTVNGGSGSGVPSGGDTSSGGVTGGGDVGPSSGTGTNTGGGDGGSGSSGATGGGGRLDLAWLALLGALVGLKRARAHSTPS